MNLTENSLDFKAKPRSLSGSLLLDACASGNSGIQFHSSFWTTANSPLPPLTSNTAQTDATRVAFDPIANVFVVLNPESEETVILWYLNPSCGGNEGQYPFGRFFGKATARTSEPSIAPLFGNATTWSDPFAVADTLRQEIEASGSTGLVADLWWGKAEQQLDSFAALATDWDSYDAEPPNATARALSRRVLAMLRERDVRPESLAPSREEGVTFSFSHGDKWAAIECYNTGEIAAVISEKTGDPEVWTIDDEDTAIRAAAKKIETFLYR